MRPSFRFDPPPAELNTELRWILWRAYGPPDAAMGTGGDLDVETVTELARRFDLVARVGARTSAEAIAEALSPEAAEWFHKHHAGTAARALLAEPVCRELAENGRLLEIPLVFLKGAALLLDGTVLPGFRNMGDIDVLAPEDGARRLQAALVESSCAAFDSRESEHQLQFLAHRSGIGIEVHKIIPGVRLGGGSSVTAGELLEKGLVRPAPGLGDGAYLPSGGILLAHVLVHGIAQHGLSPQAYPMARMLADVQDLEPGGEVWEAAHHWIERDVSREELEAVADLVQRLGGGDDPEALAEAGDGAGVMLRHLLAGVLDEGYAQSLKFRSLADRPRDMGSIPATAKTLLGALLLTKGQVDKLYGPPKTEFGYWGWRLWRPFDLVLRAVKYGAAWVGQRFRMRN